MSNHSVPSHFDVIDSFLRYLNDRTEDYILKGGTSLIECYGLDRLSEDIDLDSTNKTLIKSIVDDFCKENDFTYRVAKDADTVKRFMLHYGAEKPLKIKISYRQHFISPEDIKFINGITVYDINRIASMKCNAYTSRDKLRDLNDITFIVKKYFHYLSKDVKSFISDALQYKGIEQFDYLVETQQDDNIDIEKLASDFLDVMDMLGLIDETDGEIDNNKDDTIFVADMSHVEDDYHDDYDPID